MYLSRILLLDRNKFDFNRDTLRALTSLNRFHGALSVCFPGERPHLLWRIDNLKDALYMLILSKERANFTSFCQQFSPSENDWETKNYDMLLNNLNDGSTWKFRLTANPTVSKSHKGNNGQGKIQACKIIENQKQWLLNRSEKHGFQISYNDFDVVQSKWNIFTKSDGHRISLLSVTFEGILTVTNVELFREVLVNGIGRGKAYGMGLLTVIHV